MDSSLPRDGLIRPRSQLFPVPSRASSRRPSASSLEDEDPLSAPPRPHARLASPPKPSNAVACEPLSWPDEEDFPGFVISDLASRTRKSPPPPPPPPPTLPRAMASSTQPPPPPLPPINASTQPSLPALKVYAPRKVGRPKGWRPGMSYAAMRGYPPRVPSLTTGRPVGRPPKHITTAAAARSSRSAKPRGVPPGFAGWKRRGRPPRPPSPQPRDVYRGLKAPFVAFLCEWAGCRAELHNLDTLRRHVYAVHDAAGGCRWGKCAARHNGPDGQDPILDGRGFRTHMETAHLVPFAWHVGDGPANSSADGGRPEEEVPDYLLDSRGEQVTPSVRDQEVEDRATWRNNRTKLKELLIRMNDNLPSDEESGGYDDEP